MMISIEQLNPASIIGLLSNLISCILATVIFAGCNNQSSIDVTFESGKKSFIIPSLNLNKFEKIKDAICDDYAVYENIRDSVVLLIDESLNFADYNLMLTEEYYLGNQNRMDSNISIQIKFEVSGDSIIQQKIYFNKHSGALNYPKGYVVSFNHNIITKEIILSIEIRRIMQDFDLLEAVMWANEFSEISVK